MLSYKMISLGSETKKINYNLLELCNDFVLFRKVHKVQDENMVMENVNKTVPALQHHKGVLIYYLLW